MTNWNHLNAITFIKDILENNYINDPIMESKAKEILTEFMQGHPPKIQMDDTPIFDSRKSMDDYFRFTSVMNYSKGDTK